MGHAAQRDTGSNRLKRQMQNERNSRVPQIGRVHDLAPIIPEATICNKLVAICDRTLLR